MYQSFLYSAREGHRLSPHAEFWPSARPSVAGGCWRSGAWVSWEHLGKPGQISSPWFCVRVFTPMSWWAEPTGSGWPEWVPPWESGTRQKYTWLGNAHEAEGETPCTMTTTATSIREKGSLCSVISRVLYHPWRDGCCLVQWKKNFLHYCLE